MSKASNFKSPASEQAVMAFYDRVLAAWPVAHTTQHVETRYGDTFVITSGDPANPPLLLIHGAASNSAAWAGDIATYAESYHVHAVDLIGEAGKSAPTRPPYDTPAFAEWVDDVRIALGIETMTLAGLSQGGWTAIKYATTYPERVSALVLLTPSGVAKHNALFLVRMLILFMLGGWGQRQAVKMLFADAPLPEGTVEGMGLIMRHFNTRRETPAPFTDAELSTLTMPVLLVGGEKDGLLDVPGTVARLERLLPHFTAQIIPGAGHALVNVAPGVVGHLASLGRPTTTAM